MIIGCSQMKSNELINTHALCVYEKLITHGVSLPPYLRPQAVNLNFSQYPSIYGIAYLTFTSGSHYIRRGTANLVTVISPHLLHNLVFISFLKLNELIPAFEWFRAKGSTLK